MNTEQLVAIWKHEEEQAHIHGWDFSRIEGRYEEETDLPWDFKAIIQSYLKKDSKLLDIDTGGGEFLLSLEHLHENIAATEGYPPNVDLCRQTLLPLGIDFKEMSDCTKMPYADESFDIIINRHGEYCLSELLRTLKKGGLFITQQVGEENDRELVELLLPGTPKQFTGWNLTEQKSCIKEAGFEILRADECFRPIKFTDIGALVWFAHIIEWEFIGFSVDSCTEQLLKAQDILEQQGVVEGTTHRFLIVAKKP